jgi:hypothetical protein
VAGEAVEIVAIAVVAPTAAAVGAAGEIAIRPFSICGKSKYSVRCSWLSDYCLVPDADFRSTN